jgi:thiazole tautomerase (transcriptional regulator TenI)
MGSAGLEETVRGLDGMPIVAIGGIDPARVTDVLGAGARGVAVVRGVWGARDPAEAVGRYLDAIGQATDMKARLH